MRIILVVAFFVVSLSAKGLFQNEHQVQSSHYVEALKNLIIATQKTRGLTNSFLNGNTSALLLVYKNRKAMKKAIGEMESTSLAQDPVINSRATAITQKLVALNISATRRSDSAKVFEEYTTMIEQLLLLAQTVNRQSSRVLNPLGKEASGTMMETILPMTEYVGRFRGMGSGLVASGYASAKQSAIMLSIAQEIKSLDDELQIRMKTFAAKYPEAVDGETIATLKQIDRDVAAYIALTKKSVLKNGKHKLDPGHYFDQGTAIISLLVKVYNANNQAVMEDSKGWL